jgi:hypothetical protein
MADGGNVRPQDAGDKDGPGIDYRAIRMIRDRFVFDQATGRFFLLSKEGAWILTAIMHEQDEADTEAALMEHYGISRGTAMRDLEQFKLRLARLGLSAAPKET